MRRSARQWLAVMVVAVLGMVMMSEVSSSALLASSPSKQYKNCGQLRSLALDGDGYFGVAKNRLVVGTSLAIVNRKIYIENRRLDFDGDGIICEYENIQNPPTTTTTTTTTTIPRTTTTVAPTCATGGTCVVGDRGPGGGIVFYVGLFTASGTACSASCRYLEAAPSGWSVSLNTASLCAGKPGTSTTDPWCAWSWITLTRIGATAEGTGIGRGFGNTAAIVAQNNTAGKAATVSQAYRGGSKTDWFLPSKDELKELCKYARQQTTGNTSTACADSGSLRGGFDGLYWSSSEVNTADAWLQFFEGGYQSFGPKYVNISVRPVRAF